jgi:hypothetical protein
LRAPDDRAAEPHSDLAIRRLVELGLKAKPKG